MVRLATTASISGTTMSLSSPGRSLAYRAITAVVLIRYDKESTEVYNHLATPPWREHAPLWVLLLL
ncbi:hypothetical protein XBJ2_1860086 [Xenorhabdus bovienii str. Jollieti]|nr:hypothetical protein XBJ2_1860086 [Xenorhabdus bovienii str. Jollieti]